MSLDLKPIDPSEVSLPALIASSDLTLEQIGFLFAVASLPCDQDPEPTMIKMATLSTEGLKDLKARGILVVKMDGNKVSMSIDLDSLE